MPAPSPNPKARRSPFGPGESTALGPIPQALAARAMLPCLVIFAALGLLQGGLACWIQELNYLVAGVAAALGTAGVWHYRRSKNRSARFRGAVFLVTSWIMVVYAWRQVALHQALVAAREAEMGEVTRALERHKGVWGVYPLTLSALRVPLPTAFGFDYARRDDGYALSFTHNLIRRHVFDPKTGAWRDEG
jgi:hypothetical protein